MGSWKVDTKSRSGVLWLVLEGAMSEDEMHDFVVAHNQGVDAFGKADYRVFCDIRKLMPLSPEVAARFEQAKAYSAAHPNFQGSGVLVDSALVAMQHRRTSVAGGVMDTELISEDEQALEAHLAQVRRSSR